MVPLTSKVQCPTAEPALASLSVEARLAWETCATPLVLSTVRAAIPETDAEHLVNAVDILSGSSRKQNVFVSFPQVNNADFVHGPSYVEWKQEQNGGVDKHFFIVLAVSLCLCGCLVWFGRKGIAKFGSSARSSPFQTGITGAALGLSLLTATVGAPLLVGGWWFMKRPAAGSADVSLYDNAMESSGDEQLATEGILMAQALE